MKITNLFLLALSVLLTAGIAGADDFTCDMSGYQPAPGLKADLKSGQLELTWEGERREGLRVRFGIRDAQPVVLELAARVRRGKWSILGSNLSPEFHVNTGLRRISNQQLNPLRNLGVEITPEVTEKEKWKVFWDAPLNVPGIDGVNTGTPRKPEEIRRTDSKYNTTGCSVKTDGARIVVSFPGLSLGIFRRPAGFHGIPRNESAPAGSCRKNRRALGGLQLSRRPQGFPYPAGHAGDLARRGTSVAEV